MPNPNSTGPAQEPGLVRLTKHAYKRAAEMDVAVERVTAALQPKHRTGTWPDPDHKNMHVSSSLEPGLLFVVADTDPNLVVTLLWRTQSRFERSSVG